jgi:UDP-N-acetylmuramoyl-tripeptide--D-alanyl-D-alanine ligase
MNYTVEDICRLARGEAGGLDPQTAFEGYSIDSRTIRHGELFFAVRGENLDGHRFVEEALGRGGAAAVVSDDYQLSTAPEGRLIRVADPLQAMQVLASASRDEPGLKLIGITGSCGKTTTKDITAALLAGLVKVGRNTGNLNNLYGLPLGLLRRPAGLEYYVCEMGMSVPGEMSRLAQIARPDVAVFTNVHGVHLMNFKSVSGIADAKAEMLEGVPPDGLVVANIDDPEVMRIAKGGGRTVLTFGTAGQADVRAAEVEDRGLSGLSFRLRAAGKVLPVESPLPGLHNLQNIVAAVATGVALGLDAEELLKGLGRIELSPLRSRISEYDGGWTLFNDAYNSNPVALKHTLRVISRSNGFNRRVAVLGDMLELGAGELEAHRECGAFLALSGIDELITVGPLAATLAEAAVAAGFEAGKVIAVPDSASAIAPTIQAIERNPPGTLVLVKGSRGVKMEKIVSELAGRFQQAGSSKKGVQGT